MTTAPTLDYTGATVRVPYVGIGVVKEQVRDFYAVDLLIGSVNMRVWRESQDLKVVALVVKNTSESIEKASNSIDIPPQDKTHEAAIIAPEIRDTHNDTQRDNGPDRIQVNVKHLAERDVIELIRLDLHRPYDTELMHIVSITPHVALEPRIATVAVFRGKQGNWTSCGFCDVTFPTLTVAPFWTVCGGSKLEAARRDPTLLERTNMMSLPRWKGGGDVMRLPMSEDADYGVLKGAA